MATYPSSSRDWTIYVRQDGTDDSWSYSVFAKDRAGKVIDITKAETKGEITVRWLSAELAQISWPCGMGSVATIFIDSHGRVSRTSYWPLAVDPSRKVIAEASADEDNSVEISPIFRTPTDSKLVVKLPNPSATLIGKPVTNARFLRDGNLLITYMEGSHHASTDLMINVPK